MSEHTSELTDRIRDFRTWGFDTRGWSQSTRHAYGRRARYADRWLTEHRGVSVVEADEDDVRAWLASLTANARTRNHSRAALKGWFAFLVAQGRRQENPVDDIDTLREPRLIPKAHTTEEANAIWREAHADSPMMAAAIALFLNAGLRRSEVRHLEWTDIEDDYIRFHAKGGHERVVPLHPDVIEALERWRHECESLRWVFPGRDPSRPMSGSWLYLEVKRVAEEAGVSTHPHKLRHTYATELIENGVSLRTVQELLGHLSVATTQVYTMVRPSQLRDAVGRLPSRDAS